MVKFKLNIVVALLLLGCNPTYYLVPVEDESEGVAVYKLEQREVTISYKPETLVALNGTKEYRTFTLFLFLRNNSGEDVRIVPDSVKVFGIKGKSRKKLYTYSPMEYVDEVRRKQNLSKALAAMDKTIKDSSPENITITTNDKITRNRGLAYDDSDGPVDEEEKRKAQQQEQAQLEKKELQANFYLEGIKSKLLKETVLKPGTEVYGDVMIKMESFKKYLLQIPVGNNVHEIYFTLSKR